MIPRLLVPFDARPSTLEPTARRRPSTLDDRTLVPSGLAIVPLETKTNIPASLPLDTIAARFVVPRDINPEAYQVVEEPHALPPQPSEMDERVTVPLGAASPLVIPPPPSVPTDLVEKDIFLTGEVNLLNDEEALRKQNRKNLVDRIYSVAIHVAVILLLVYPPSFLRKRPPTQGDLEIARKQMTLLLPPGAFENLRTEPRPAPPRIKVDPKVLRKIAPPEVVPEPAPQPVPQPKTPARELPAAPNVQPNANQPPPPSPAPKTEAPPNNAPKLEAPDAPKTQPNLVLPKSSGNALRDTLHDMSRSANGQRSGTYSAPDARPPLPGGGRQGGGAPGAGMGNAVQILTPTEGVDFNDYIQRVIASVKRNWYAVMPESAQLGDKGVVVLEFSIHRDGSVPANEPDRLRGSGKEPLDRAAISAIRSSNPFDHLPPAFSGPEIRLRFIFLYNLPLDAANQQ